MKSKFRLNLPWGIYASILVLLSIATLIWASVNSTDAKKIINYAYYLLVQYFKVPYS